MAILTSWNIHVLALLAISILLFGSIQWCVTLTSTSPLMHFRGPGLTEKTAERVTATRRRFINELGQIEVQKAQQDKVKAGKENGAAVPLSAEGASATRIGDTTSRQDAPGNSALTERRVNMASDE